MATRKTATKEEMLWHLQNCNEIAVIDIETTGLSRDKGAEIIEIGVFRYNFNLKKARKFHCYVKPKNGRVPKKIIELTGITNEDVKNAPYEEIVLPKLRDFIGDCPLVFHNAAFDWTRFLKKGFMSAGCYITNPVLCTKVLSKWLLPLQGYDGPYKLESLCSYFGCEIQGAHRADNDARYTAALANRLREIGFSLNSQVSGFGIKAETNKQICTFNDVRIQRITPWHKGKHERLYIETSVASIYYDYNRKLWTVNRLKKDEEIDMGIWENFLAKTCSISDMSTWLEDHRMN